MLRMLKEDGPPVPSDGLSIEVMVRNATIRPVTGMPPIAEADHKTTIKGRNVVVQIGRGVVDLGGGRTSDQRPVGRPTAPGRV